MPWHIAVSYLDHWALWPSGLGNWMECKRFAVKTLLWSLEYVTHNISRARHHHQGPVNTLNMSTTKIDKYFTIFRLSIFGTQRGISCNSFSVGFIASLIHNVLKWADTLWKSSSNYCKIFKVCDHFGTLCIKGLSFTLKTHHVHSTLKWRENEHFHVVSTCL